MVLTKIEGIENPVQYFETCQIFFYLYAYVGFAVEEN